MSITAQTGSVAFGLQSAKGVLATNWYTSKVNNIRMGAVVAQDTPPPEIGGANNPTGAYKKNASFAGSFAMAPRLKDVFGVLLYGVTGQDVVTDNANGTFTHKLTQKTGDATFIPWMSLRAKVPGTAAVDDRGEVGKDCKIAALELAFPQAGPVAANTTIQGLEPTQADSVDISTWVDANTYENFDSVPMSMKGSVAFTGVAALGPIKALGAKVSFVNGLTTPQQEQIMGQYFGEDLTTRTRVLQIELTVKHTDAKLSSYFFNGDATAADNAFKEEMKYAGIVIDVQTPGVINSGVVDFPWELKVSADKIAWQPNGPIAMQGDELLVQQWVGIVIEADTGNTEDYYSIELTNTRSASYATA